MEGTNSLISAPISHQIIPTFIKSKANNSLLEFQLKLPYAWARLTSNDSRVQRKCSRSEMEYSVGAEKHVGLNDDSTYTSSTSLGQCRWTVVY